MSVINTEKTKQHLAIQCFVYRGGDELQIVRQDGEKQIVSWLRMLDWMHEILLDGDNRIIPNKVYVRSGMKNGLPVFKRVE
jgi:hypothetical protein